MIEINRDFEFAGWDFEELFDAFGIKTMEGEDADTRVNMIRSELQLFFYGNTSSEEDQKAVIRMLKQFLEKLVSEEKNIGGSHRPLFEGILKLENDHMFIQVFLKNIEFMWT